MSSRWSCARTVAAHCAENLPAVERGKHVEGGAERYPRPADVADVNASHARSSARDVLAGGCVVGDAGRRRTPSVDRSAAPGGPCRVRGVGGGAARHDRSRLRATANAALMYLLTGWSGLGTALTTWLGGLLALGCRDAEWMLSATATTPATTMPDTASKMGATPNRGARADDARARRGRPSGADPVAGDRPNAPRSHPDRRQDRPTLPASACRPAVPQLPSEFMELGHVGLSSSSRSVARPRLTRFLITSSDVRRPRAMSP